MKNRLAIRRRNNITSFARVLRAFAEASLAALGFAVAILLIGTPVALSVRGVHEGLSWLAASGGKTSALVEALVSVSGVVGGLVLAWLFARLLVGLFNWRRRLRTRVVSKPPAATRLDRQEIAGAL